MGFTENGLKEKVRRLLSQLHALRSDDDIYYCMRWRLKLEGETEMMMMMFSTINARDQSSKGRRRICAFGRVQDKEAG